MFRFIPFALAAALAVPASARAWIMEDLVSPEKFESVTIVISDQAVDGCWTNIGEAKTYAEDKLSELGFKVLPEDEMVSIRVLLTVASARTPVGCYGSVSIETTAPAMLWETKEPAMALVGSVGGIFAGQDKANLIVLRYIEDLVDEMENSADSSN